MIYKEYGHFHNKKINDLTKEIEEIQEEIDVEIQKRNSILLNFRKVIDCDYNYDYMSPDLIEALTIISLFPFEIKVIDYAKRPSLDECIIETTTMRERKNLEDLTPQELNKSNEFLKQITDLLINYMRENVINFDKLEK